MACKGRTNCAADTEASTDSRSQAPFYYIFLLVSPPPFHLSYYLGQFIDAKPNLSGDFACENEKKISKLNIVRRWISLCMMVIWNQFEAIWLYSSTSVVAKCLREAESCLQKHFVGS